MSRSGDFSKGYDDQHPQCEGCGKHGPDVKEHEVYSEKHASEGPYDDRDFEGHAHYHSECAKKWSGKAEGRKMQEV